MVGRGIALLFHDHGTKRGWMVSSTPRPLFTPGKDPVPIVQEAGWALRPVRTGGKSRPTGIRSPDRPSRSQSLYWLSYSAHDLLHVMHMKDKRMSVFHFTFEILLTGGFSSVSSLSFFRVSLAKIDWGTWAWGKSGILWISNRCSYMQSILCLWFRAS